MSKYIDAIRRLAKMKALDAKSAEKLLNAHSEDGGPGSGNFGHRGRPGKKGGSAPRGGGGAATSATTNPSGTPSGQTVHFYNPKKPSFPGRRPETEKVTGRGNSKLWEEVSRWTLPECPVHPPTWNSRGEYSYLPGTPEEERQKYEKYKQEKAAWEAKEAKKRGYKSFEEMKKDYDKKRGKALEKAMKSSSKLTTTSPLSEPESNPYDYHRELTATEHAALIRAKRDGVERKTKSRNPSAEEIAATDRITATGEVSLKHAVASEDSGTRFSGKAPKNFPEGSTFNNPKPGKPTKQLPKGTGATRLDPDDLSKPGDKHSICKHLDDEGRLTPEREALHAAAVSARFVGKKPVPPGGKKQAWLFGGGSASGKGGLSDPERCKTFGTPSYEEVATFDPDEFKEDTPEYRRMQNSGDKQQQKEAAPFSHEESSAMAKRGIEAAIANGYNYTLDGTGDGSVSGMKKKIAQARNAGYEVNGCYVTCPTKMAEERAIARAKEKGRDVPVDRLRSIHRSVSEIFPQIASEFDHVTLWDTRGDKPVLIAECHRGQEIDIKDQKLWDEFTAKAEEKY